MPRYWRKLREKTRKDREVQAMARHVSEGQEPSFGVTTSSLAWSVIQAVAVTAVVLVVLLNVVSQ